MNEEQKLEIEKARKENRDKRVENRLRVLSLKAEGATYKEIMTVTGYSKANIANILKTYFEKGISEIKGGSLNGRKSDLLCACKTRMEKNYTQKQTSEEGKR